LQFLLTSAILAGIVCIVKQGDVQKKCTFLL